MKWTTPSAPCARSRSRKTSTADVGESNDLSAARPETLAELKRSFETWEAELPAPRWPPSFMERATRKPAPRERPAAGRE